EIMLSLARALSSEKNTRPESVQLYRQILAKDSDNTELNFEFVELLSWQDSTRREALIKYFDMLDVYPGNPKVQNGFEETLSWYLPTDADIELYEKILAKYPDNINAVKGLAYLASQYEDKSKAIDLYKKLLSFDPDNVDITYQYANLLASNEDTRKEAIDILEKVYNQKPDNLDVLTTLANNLLYTKKYKKAKDLYDKILNLSPDNKDALIGKARIYGWQGLNLAAYKAYTRVYEMYPYDADVAYEYASIAKKLGKNAKALEILQKIKGHSMLPDVPDMPEIAMAINYQVMSVDHSYSGSPVQSNADLNKIQTDLHDIENSIKELEKQLENLQKVNNELDNKTHTIVNQQNNAQINTTNYTETYQELSDGYKSNTYSPFMLQNESLPEPVMPKTITQTVTYNENDPYLSSPYDYPAVINDKTYDEIVLNSGYEPDPIHFRITGFEDALSGRRYDIMHDFFGDLEKDIMYDMRPEIRTSFMFSNEAGDATADAMEMHGYPSFFSVNVTPQNRFSFGVTSATYGMTTSVHPASITATSYIMGWNSRPHERVNFDAELAINSFSDPQAPVDVTGKAKLELKLHDRLRLKLGYRREPLYQSVFETTGYTIQPQYSRLQLATLMGIESGPLYNPNNAINYQRLLADPNYYDQLRGQFMGQVRDNAVAVEATFIPFNKWDVNAGYEYSAVRGENIEHNGRHQALFSVGRTFTGIPNHLFRLGYQFLFFGYRKDLSAFPNMTSYPYLENGRPIPVTRQMEYNEAFTTANQANNWSIPSDVWNDPTGATVTRRPSLVDFIRAPRGVGIGGYFSPTQFYLNSFRFDFEGKVFNGRLYYKGGASLGVQQIGDRVSRNDLLAARGLENFGTVAPNDPRLRFPAFRANYDAAQSIRDSSDPTSLASAFDFTAFLKITDFLTVYSGVDYLNTGAFDRWRYNGGLILRPAIDSLTPIFRKPKVSPSTTPEDDNQ
ncbi:MAG: tetratricopeptide repeat protein, partial [Cyanobacteriota bacterium]